MKIKDIFALLESMTGISVDSLGIADMVDHADDLLPSPAADAIDRFVGMVPGAKKTGIWGGIMQARSLEDAYSDSPGEQGRLIRNQLDSAFEPIKNKLRQMHGDSILLYRAQEPLSSDMPRRHTLSWTSDFRVAADVAGVDGRLLSLRPITDDEIAKAVSIYRKDGTLTWRGKKYVRTDTPTNDPALDEYYYDIFDRDGDHITDGDDIEGSLRSVQSAIDDMIESRDKRLSRIVSARIPIDSIIWITDRAGQSEFILRNQPTKIGYIDTKGKLLGLDR